MQATFLTGFDGTKAIFDVSPGVARGRPRRDGAQDRLAYAALVYTGETQAEAYAGAEKLLWYITRTRSRRISPARPVMCRLRQAEDVARGGTSAECLSQVSSVEGAIKAGIMMAGTPDQVVDQVRAVYDHVGGFGHLLNMGQAGFLEHDETVRGIKLFAREVLPRLQEFRS